MKRKSLKPNNGCSRSWPASTIWFSSQKRPDSVRLRVRFMESPHSLLRTHWDHEPPLTRPSATLSPSDGEREGVRGRFMERPSGDYSLVWNLRRWPVAGIVTAYDLA